MTVTPSDLNTSETDVAVEAVDQDVVDAAAELDLDIPEEVPSADDPSSRAVARDLDGVGFTLDEFASLLSKYDYNFKPGDVVKGTVFAIEPKGSMIDIGAKTAAFMPMQEVSINRVEHISDVPEPGDMLTDPQKVFEKAEEMAARYKQMLLEQAEDGEMGYE